MFVYKPFNTPQMSRRVVITGMGAITPLGNTATDFLRALTAGENGVTSITKFDTTKFKTQFACEIKGYIPENHFDRKELRKLDPFCQYALIAADEAISQSGIMLSNNTDTYRVGVVWGSGYGGVTSMQDQVIDYGIHDRVPRFTPFFLPRMLINIAPALIAIKYGFKGINYSPVAACASSNVAILDGYKQIANGIADAIICGGSEAAISEAGIGAFNAAMALSTNNEEMTTACRPFDVRRDGFVMGEGAGAIVLEELEHALQRGATIFAEVKGGAMTCDAHHITAPHPDGEGVSKAMQLALADAKLKTEDVDYINAHATSTPLGDVCEIKAIESLFGSHSSNMAISATKSMTGHLLGAAGVVEAMACIYAVKNNVVMPTINTTQIDPQINPKLNFTLGKANTKTIDVALNNTFGFGGQNVITVFGKYKI
jgi:3-oxoacyl-[acyl-carrier-protein] synthase II